MRVVTQRVGQFDQRVEIVHPTEVTGVGDDEFAGEAPGRAKLLGCACWCGYESGRGPVGPEHHRDLAVRLDAEVREVRARDALDADAARFRDAHEGRLRVGVAEALLELRTGDPGLRAQVRGREDAAANRQEMRHEGDLATLAVALATPASAQLLARKDLSLATALTIATTAIETCKTNGFATSTTVVGRNGEVLVQLRGDNTGPHTMENAFKKAFTSRTFRIPSGEMEKRLKDNPQMGAQYLTGFTTGRGALPIKVGDDVIGAAGASGAPGGEKDEACIQTGLDKIKDQVIAKQK